MKSFNLDTTVTVCGGTPQEPINVSNSNDTYVVDTLVDLELPDITVTDSDGTVSTVPSMEDVVCTPSAPTSVRVSNSDDSYDVNTSVDLELPDSSVSNSNNSYVNTLPATEDLALPNINFTDSDGITTSVPSMEDIVAAPCPVKSGIKYNRSLTTAQSISYSLYDDAWQRVNNPPPPDPLNPIHTAALLDWFTLVDNNVFGNKSRFTNSLGLTTSYDGSGGELPDYAINHLSGEGRKITRVPNQNTNGYVWGVSLSAANNHIENGFSDWFIDDMQQAQDLTNSDNGLNYAPFNINGNIFLFCSTTYILNSTKIYPFIPSRMNCSSAIGKSFGRDYLLKRWHY